MKKTVVFGWIILLCCLADTFGAERPNVVMILIDDMGWKDLTCTGSTSYRTPHIDRLATQGIRFTAAHSAAIVCAPSRGALLSGRHPARTRFTTVYSRETSDQLFDVSKSQGGKNQMLEARHTHALPRTTVTFGQAFTEAGYRTGFFGKWHVGAAEGYYPDQRGFEVAAGYRRVLATTGKSGHWGKTFKNYGANMEHIGDDDSVADVLTSAACGFIETHRNEPFLIVLSHYLVHAPIVRFEDKLPPERTFQGDQNNAGFTSMVETVDDSVGTIIQTLEKLGIASNTVVIFTSDNGGLSGPTSNYPLLGGKSTPYMAGTQVPLIISWPGQIPAGNLCDVPTVSMDLYPTMLDLAGLPLRPENHADGISIKPLLNPAPPRFERKPLAFHFPHYTGSTGPFSSIIDSDWKLLRFYNDETGRFQLFNLKQDPSEQNDLADHPEQSGRIGKLDRQLTEQLLAMDALMPRANPAYDPENPKNKNRATIYSRASGIWKRQEAATLQP